MVIQIKEENDILLMYQMTEPCTKIIKHGLQSSFLTTYPRYKVCRPSLLALPSKSKQEDWMHTFSSTTPGLGVDNNLDKV